MTFYQIDFAYEQNSEQYYSSYSPRTNVACGSQRGYSYIHLFFFLSFFFFLASKTYIESVLVSHFGLYGRQTSEHADIKDVSVLLESELIDSV